MSGSGKHFVLVHGSCHGAWCWFRLPPLLEAAGHKVTALDLGASGINPKQLSDIHNINDYFEPLFSFFENLIEGEKVVLVGHSRGGFAICAAMEKYPHKVAVGVFATALVLGPRFTIVDFHNTKDPPASAYGPDSVITYDDKGRFTSIFFGPIFLKEHVYQLSSAEDLTLANMLARAYPFFDDERSSAALKLTDANYGSVTRVFIISENDTGITPAFAHYLMEKTGITESYTVHGSDHMIMISQPEQLSDKLQLIAAKHA